MIAAPIPPDDDERLQALHALLILDTPPEARFDRIVQFAATEFDMPIVLVSLVDKSRQWFKARVGLDVCETDRENSFCGHAIVEPGLFVIEDALADERFADNPLVVGDPKIRFYAGAPLQLPTGRIVGTLCMIDRAPRTLDALERAIFGSLCDLVLGELVGQGEAFGVDA
jgi:GAF domain-containing protein